MCGGEDSYSYEWRVSYGDPGNYGPVESTDATFNMTLMTGHNYAKLTVSDGTSETNTYYSTYVHQDDCDDPTQPCIEDTESPLTESQPDESKPESFDLHSAYPNPFNPVTNLSFDLPEESQVSLAVYDLLGRQVQQVVSGTKQAGTHTYSFDASDLPSGTYIVRMAADGFEKTMNITLVK